MSIAPITTWPKEIFLQAGDDDLEEYSQYSEVTWCEDPACDTTVKYIRADLSAPPLPLQEGGAPRHADQAINAFREYAKNEFWENKMPAHRDREDGFLAGWDAHKSIKGEAAVSPQGGEQTEPAGWGVFWIEKGMQCSTLEYSEGEALGFAASLGIAGAAIEPVYRRAAVLPQGGAENTISMPLKEAIAIQNKFYKQGYDDAIAVVPQGVEAKVDQDRLLAALERAASAETALRNLVDECDNDSAPGWEDRMRECIDRANRLLAAPASLGEAKAVAPEWPQWSEAKRICDLTEVHECLSSFSHDSTEDNAICLIREILSYAAPVAQALPVAAETKQALINALDLALRQNEHDMLLTGEELRAGRAVLAAALQGDKA